MFFIMIDIVTEPMLKRWAQY